MKPNTSIVLYVGVFSWVLKAHSVNQCYELSLTTGHSKRTEKIDDEIISSDK